MLEQLTLENGVEVYYRNCRDTQNLGLAVLVGSGSAYEEKEKRGITHMLEHMLFKSNEKFSYHEMNKIIEFSGGDWNGSTYWDSMTIYLEALSSKFHRILDVIESIITNKSFKENEFKNEKSVVLTEIENSLNDPSSRIYQLGLRALFGESDLGEPISGLKETVSDLEVSDIVEYKNRIFVSKNVKVVLIGNLKEKHLEKIEEVFRQVPNVNYTKKTPTVDTPSDIVEKMETGEQCYLASTWEVKPKELLEVIMLENILVAGSYNILFEELREKRGIGYSFGVVHDFIMDTGYINIVIEGYDCNKRELAKQTVLEILDNIRENSIEADLIQGKKNYLRFTREKFKNFYADRSEDTARKINHGHKIESMELTDKLLEKPWIGFEKIIREPVFAEIIPK